jgi:hypothetical protein
MQIHGRAKLGPAGRLALCEAIEGGMTFRQAAAAMSASPATAHRWWHRYARALPAERQSLASAADRSSRLGLVGRKGRRSGPARAGEGHSYFPAAGVRFSTDEAGVE